MRCRQCRTVIAGIGKPAIPPTVPAVVGLAGVLAGLWYLTLSQNPANPMPAWSPSIGWVAALGGLALASALSWICMFRRKCPACGSRQMLDAMEEEALIASERLAPQKDAADVSEEGREDGRQRLRAEIEAELRSALVKETGDQVAAREQALRARVEEELRARLTSELRPRLEQELRPVLEKELRKTLGSEHNQEAEKAHAAEKAEAEKEQKAPRPPEQPKKATAATARPAARTGVQVPGAWQRKVQPATAHAKVDTAPISLKSSRPSAPPPFPTGSALPPAKTPTPVAEPVHERADTEKTLRSAPTQEPLHEPPTLPSTPPAALPVQPAPVPAPVKTPTPVAEPAPARADTETASPSAPTQAPLHERATQPSTPSGTGGDDRARRRARVILSDMSLYHRELLLKAARSDDPKAELGTIWKDAVTSYNEVISPDLIGAANYLEEELQKRLTQLRQPESNSTGGRS
jgi:hypothetical protein